MRASTVGRPLLGWFKILFRSIADLYRRGIAMVWLAPLVLALVILPEFLQHIVEIRLGMFDSRDAARALGDHPMRMAFGYLKVAGVILTFLAAARFWAARDRGVAWYRLSDIAWGRLVIGFLLFGLLPVVPALLQAQIGKSAADIAGILLSIALLPMLFLMLAGLFGDRATPVSAMWGRCWPWAILTIILMVLAFAPAQWLHGMNHHWAIGADPVIVWALMIFDSLLVGLLAGLTGTALYLGYAGFRDSVSPIPNQDRLSPRA